MSGPTSRRTQARRSDPTRAGVGRRSVAGDDLKTEVRDLAGLVGLIADDAERLLVQHVDLLRSEFPRGLREVPPAIASIGAGVGLVAVGGILGSLMLVHGLHKSTRIPLWGCYGLVGGAMATA